MAEILSQDQYVNFSPNNSQAASVNGDIYSINSINNRNTAITLQDTNYAASYQALLAQLQATIIALNEQKNLDMVHLFTIDLNTRSITAPLDFESFLGVVGEHKSEVITFVVDRYYDDVDLTRMMIVVEYINADGESKVSPIVVRDYETGLQLDDPRFQNKILFDWFIDSSMTSKAGIVSFAVRFYMTDENGRLVYSLRTKPYESRIIDALPLNQQQFDLDNLPQFEQELGALIAETQRLRNELIEASHVYWNDIIKD